jgi:hypothetical protein
VRILLTFVFRAKKRRVHVGGYPGGTHAAWGRRGIGENKPQETLSAPLLVMAASHFKKDTVYEIKAYWFSS